LKNSNIEAKTNTSLLAFVTMNLMPSKTIARIKYRMKAMKWGKKIRGKLKNP